MSVKTAEMRIAPVCLLEDMVKKTLFGSNRWTMGASELRVSLGVSDEHRGHYGY